MARVPPLTLAALALAWLLGIVAASFAGTEPLVFVATTAACSAVFLTVRPRPATLVVAALAVPVIALGFWRYDTTIPDENGGVSHLNDGPAVTVRGVVGDEPQERATSLVYRLDVQDVLVGDEWREEEGAILVRTSLYDRYQYGDFIEIAGELETPQAFSGFDYRGYLLRKGVTSVAAYPDVRLISHNTGSWWKTPLVGFRRNLSEALSNILPQPHASLAAGVMFGARESISADLRGDMSATGTSHLVAVSGQNVAMLAALILALSSWAVGRRWAGSTSISVD